MVSTAGGTVTVRWSREEDASALRRLAELDSARLTAGPMLVAEIDGELRAAMAVGDDTVIANPFQRTTYLVRLLDTTRQERLHDGTRSPASMWWQVARAAAVLLRLRVRPKVA